MNGPDYIGSLSKRGFAAGRLRALLLILALLLAACGSAGGAAPTVEGASGEGVSGEGTPGDAVPPGDATPQPVGGVRAIVTRLVEQITLVTSTPDPAATPTPPSTIIELDLTQSGRLRDLDPGLAEQQSQLDLAQNLFVGLTNYNPDTDTIEPELASTWAVGPDGRTWTFNLRDDIYWVRSNAPLRRGEALATATQLRPVTADDVVFAIQRFCSRQISASAAFNLFVIEGCEEVFTKLEPTEEDLETIQVRALSPTLLEIRLREPNGSFLTLTSMPFFQPVPRDLVTESGNEWLNAIGEYSSGWQTPENIVTSGPFMPVRSELTSQFLKLHRNPLWPLNRPGNVDVINVTFFDDDLDAFQMWQERSFDIAPLPTSERDAMLQRQPDKVRTLPEYILFYLGFNFNSPVMAEPELRRALSAAIDRQELIDELYNGKGILMRHATVPGMVASVPALDFGVGYSPDFARQQMAASSIQNCRLLPEVTLRVSSADLSLRQAEMIRNMWVEELNCLEENIHIEQANFGQLLAGTKQDSDIRPDMWELAWAPTFPDASNLITKLLHCRDSDNRQDRPCSEADTLMTRAGSIIDPAERAALYRQAEGLFFNENGLFPIIPLYVRAREIVVQEWLSFTPVSFGGQQWDRVVVDATQKELEKSR